MSGNAKSFEVSLQPIRPGSACLIVGNGPSRSVLRWPFVLQVLRREAPVDLVLINREALGRTRPDLAVATKRHLGRKVAQRWPDVPLVTPESSPSWWPDLAAGPRAVWACSAMGYERIYLYALDGSMEDGADPKYRRWEAQIEQHVQTRIPIGGMPMLVRILPQTVPHAGAKDPLAVERTVRL